MATDTYKKFLESLPDDWEQKSLAELGEIYSGGTPSRDREELWNGNIAWVTPSEITKLRTSTLAETDEYITQLGHQSSAAYLLPVGSLLVTTRATIGLVAIAGLPVTTNQGFKNIILNGNDSSRYYYHLLKYISPEMSRLASGSTFLEISGKSFGAIIVPRPYKDEQALIADILDTLDDAIHQTQQLIDKLKDVRAGLLHDLLTYGIDAKKFPEKPFTDFAYINPTTDWSHLSQDAVVHFIPMEDVSEDGIWTNQQQRSLASVRSGYTVFTEADVLFAKITPCTENGKGCHAVNLDHGVGFGSTEFHVIRAKPHVNSRFLYYWCQSPLLRKKAESVMSGSAGQQRVPKDFFERFTISELPVTEQVAVVDVLDSITERINRERALQVKLVQLKNGLADDLLTGKVRVIALLEDSD